MQFDKRFHYIVMLPGQSIWYQLPHGSQVEFQGIRRGSLVFTRASIPHKTEIAALHKLGWYVEELTPRDMRTFMDSLNEAMIPADSLPVDPSEKALADAINAMHTKVHGTGLTHPKLSSN